jgi:hypothetical protein
MPRRKLEGQTCWNSTYLAYVILLNAQCFILLGDFENYSGLELKICQPGVRQ